MIGIDWHPLLIAVVNETTDREKKRSLKSCFLSFYFFYGWEAIYSYLLLVITSIYSYQTTVPIHYIDTPTVVDRLCFVQYVS